jgi:hypothetical protein
MSLDEDLLASETELSTGGPEAFRRHADDECVVIFAEMAKLSREDVARTSGPIVGYECTATRKDGVLHHSYVSSGYPRRGSGWKLAFHQQTKLLTSW